MWSKVVEADMDPSRIDVVARAVKYDLIPHFEAQRGARRGFWMANRTSGKVLVVTIWSDQDSLDAGGSADGANRANVVERTGLSIRVVETMEVLTATDPDLIAAPVRWARATWIAGGATDPDAHLAKMRAIGPADQRRTSCFRGAYWFGDTTTSAGDLVLSLWDGPAEPRPLEDALGCTINRVSAYESLGIAAAPRT